MYQHLRRLLTVMRDAANPFIDWHDVATTIWSVGLYLAVFGFALVPSDWLGSLPHAARVAASMAGLFAVFLIHAYRLQMKTEQLEAKNVVIRDVQGKLNRIAVLRGQGSAWLELSGRDVTYWRQVERPLVEPWRQEIGVMIAETRGRNEYYPFMNDRAAASRFLTNPGGRDHVDGILRLQNQLNVLDHLEEKLVEASKL